MPLILTVLALQQESGFISGKRRQKRNQRLVWKRKGCTRKRFKTRLNTNLKRKIKDCEIDGALQNGISEGLEGDKEGKCAQGEVHTGKSGILRHGTPEGDVAHRFNENDMDGSLEQSNSSNCLTYDIKGNDFNSLNRTEEKVPSKIKDRTKHCV